MTQKMSGLMMSGIPTHLYRKKPKLIAYNIIYSNYHNIP